MHAYWGPVYISGDKCIHGLCVNWKRMASLNWLGITVLLGQRVEADLILASHSNVRLDPGYAHRRCWTTISTSDVVSYV